MKRLRLLLVILPLIISTTAIRVPVENNDESKSNQSANNTSQSGNSRHPIYYEDEADDHVDSYLIPPNPHKEEEVLPDSIVTPATYLLPPSINQNDYYYAPTESTGQTDWYPISQTVPQDQLLKLLPLRQQNAPIPIFMDNANHSEPFEVYQRPRAGRVLSFPIPSLNLEPPARDAKNDFIISVPSKELELPAEEIDTQYAQPDEDYPDLKFRFNSDYPTIASHLTPPKQVVRKFKNPTKLYPKKYPGSFLPLPIPIGQYDDLPIEAPRAKPAKYFKPTTGFEGPVLIPIDDKKTYLFEQADEKRKFKGENEALQEQDAPSAENLGDDVPPIEQDVSETNFRYPGHNVYRPYPAPLRQRPAPSPAPAPAPAPAQQQNGPPATDDRTEFRMHGMKGPHSYQFGYDTGKGKNRQFRFEERDNDGLVRGHYGYMDKNGKMRVVNYRAHPEYGFQADPQVETQAEPKAEQEEAREP